jgi:starch phosphorylase
MLVRAPGSEDLRRAADELAARLPSALAPLARLAFNYRWSWTRGGEEVFAAVDAHRWSKCGRNPVRLLQETSTAALERAASDPELRRRAYSLEECILVEASRAVSFDGPDGGRPIAFFCAEFGVHPSLPIYAGGLGVLAGDWLKGASDLGVPMVGVGLLYRQGYFKQRMDTSGWQHEYWIETDPERLPAALVTRDDNEPVTITVPIRGRDVVVQIWRIDVGRIPLFLLDADRPENNRIDRWINSRLYVGDRDTRLAQYALLGLGGVRALDALGIDARLLHLNEGHAAFAPLEWAAHRVARGDSPPEALAAARHHTVFTTHTPVAAGNETFSRGDLVRVLSGLSDRLRLPWDEIFALGCQDPSDQSQLPGLTPLGLRLSHRANGVSRRHGEVARAMWRRTFGASTDAEVPIGHVTNGVHLCTWMAPTLRELLDHHLGQGWESRTADPATWAKLADVPDTALWRVRCDLRTRLVEFVREHATVDRLSRGESASYVELATHAFDPDCLVIGFARRLATYKRLALISRHFDRAVRLLAGDRPIQIVLAGKAHPADDDAKRVLQALFVDKGAPQVGSRIAYLHDYDMGIAQALVAGCDVWLNLPRPPLEASGTSGMKSALNGGLNLSVLDGWWAEAYDGSNGFAIEGEVDADLEGQDERHNLALLDLLEKRIVPLFYDRDADGVPREWLRWVRASLRTAALGFTSRRMVGDYLEKVYRHEPGPSAPASAPRPAGP